MKKNINITIEEAINGFASIIHQSVAKGDYGLDIEELITNIHWDIMNSCDDFIASYDYGCRSVIHLSQMQDPMYHICKEQTKAIENGVKDFNEWYFKDLKEEQKLGCKNADEYLIKAQEMVNRDNATASDVKALDDYDNSLSYFLNEQGTTIVFDTRYYAKDNVRNKIGYDVVLVQVHVNADNPIQFISPTGKNAYIRLFNANWFTQAIQMQDFLKGFFTNSEAKIISACISGEAFVDPNSNLVENYFI
jgi:hypothetical protein